MCAFYVCLCGYLYRLLLCDGDLYEWDFKNSNYIKGYCETLLRVLTELCLGGCVGWISEV